MISQLNTRFISSRINTTTTSSISHSGYTSSGSDRSSTSVHRASAPPPTMETLSDGGSSNGYAADRSAQPSLPSHLKGPDFMKRSNDVAAPSLQPALKRLRTTYNTAELNYLASKAREVIEQAGLVYPKLQANTPRMFPPKSGVDMSGVTHTYASQYDSPFLAPNRDVGNNYMGCPYELTSLLQSTSSFYRLVPDINMPLPTSFSNVVQMMQKNISTEPMFNNDNKETYSDAESSTSSVTVSDTGHCRRTGNHSNGNADASDPPRSTALLLNSMAAQVATTTHSDHHHPARSSIIPIGTALEISHRPRIITSAQAPYHVVQVNAAFLRLSESKSTNDFLGKPLQDCLQMQCDESETEDRNIVSLATGLKSSYTTMEKVSVPGYANLLRRRRRQVPSAPATTNHIHHISIVPVGVPPKHDTDGKVTHLAIKFSLTPSVRPTSSLSSTSVSHLSNVTRSTSGDRINHPPRESNNDSAIRVMG